LIISERQKKNNWYKYESDDTQNLVTNNIPMIRSGGDGSLYLPYIVVPMTADKTIVAITPQATCN